MTGSGTWRPAVIRSASITVLPVTWTLVGSIPSRTQVAARPRRGGEMHLGQVSGQHPVLLLGKWVIAPTRPQPGLDVPERDAVVIAGQGGAEDRGGISLGEDQVGLLLLEGSRERGQRPRGQVRQRLVGPHQIEIVVGRQAEVGQGLVEQRSMLAGRENPHLATLHPAQPEDDRGHLDDFRTRSYNT